MALFDAQDRRFVRTAARLAFAANPFLPERIDLEREALGDEFIAADSVWSLSPEGASERANIVRLNRRLETTARRGRDRLAKEPAAASDADLALYVDLVVFLLYQRYRLELHALIGVENDRREAAAGKLWRQFLPDAQHFLGPAGKRLHAAYTPAHLFACYFQFRRAFVAVYESIVGRSLLAAQLRAKVWQSVFTHDLGRYLRGRFQRMGNISTLICGPSGTGKDLVARAIGLSRYVPFDAKTGRFVESYSESFHSLNVAALSPTLIESELFGHKRGSFTGAIADRVGWLEACSAHGAVFLDEIGELDASLQVKLLRVLQTRTFQRVGETSQLRFAGRIIAATNRNLGQEIRSGRFREDLYYRLCSDMIHTPSLRSLLDDAPDDLPLLVAFVARQIDGDEVDALVEESMGWIRQRLGLGYSWPGNFRELEQCVRNIWIRRSYQPALDGADPATGDRADRVGNRMRLGELTAEELLREYCAIVFGLTGSYKETASRLNLDWRTVKAKVGAAENGPRPMA